MTAPPSIDTFVAHPARRYDYWLGGKDKLSTSSTSPGGPHPFQDFRSVTNVRPAIRLSGCSAGGCPGARVSAGPADSYPQGSTRGRRAAGERRYGGGYRAACEEV
ncbi:hypothetical protein GCM10010435_72040 [Winogradskya consettensis]